LKIVKGHKTSLHCHFNKDTIIIVLKGSAKIELINNEVISLNVMESLFLPHYNFHGLGTFSDEVYIIEIEVPRTENYKIDLVKLNLILSTWFLKNKKDAQFDTINFACFKEPLLIYTIKQKSELLGGFRLNFLTESKVVDFSIATKIQKISKVLDY